MRREAAKKICRIMYLSLFSLAVTPNSVLVGNATLQNSVVVQLCPLRNVCFQHLSRRRVLAC